MVAYGLSLSQVEQQLTNNNANAGGSFIQEGLQQINVREVGLVDRRPRHRETVIPTKTALRFASKILPSFRRARKSGWASLRAAPCPSIARDGKIIDNDDVVSGIVLLRKGAAADPALKRHARQN